MAFRLRHRPMARELRRVAQKELDVAITRLQRGNAAEADIHEARKSVKKVRAIVKLLRVPLGGRYATENGRLRAAGHRLARVRDADAMLQTLERLRGRYSAVITRTLEQRIARRLRREQRNARKRARTIAAQAAGILKQVRKTLPRRIAHVGGWSSVRAAVIKVYERARLEMADLTPDSSAAEFHVWRRRVKEHWYHVRLFERQHPTPRSRARSLKTLETRLGDEHNLALLNVLVVENSDRFGDARTTSLVLGCIQKNERALRRQALTNARRLFSLKPKDFSTRVTQWWRPTGEN